jgi:hypothetical protein
MDDAEQSPDGALAHPFEGVLDGRMPYRPAAVTLLTAHPCWECCSYLCHDRDPALWAPGPHARYNMYYGSIRRAVLTEYVPAAAHRAPSRFPPQRLAWPPAAMRERARGWTAGAVRRCRAREMAESTDMMS